MNIDFAAPIQKKIVALDRISVLRLQADDSGIAYFPHSGETKLDPLLTQHLWNEPGVQAHWMPKFGLGVGAYVNPDSATLQLMSLQRAARSEFENALEEALADPVWVARHAEIAREAMLAEVQSAAFFMEIAWEKAMEIPATHHLNRWRATSIFGLVSRI